MKPINKHIMDEKKMKFIKTIVIGITILLLAIALVQLVESGGYVKVAGPGGGAPSSDSGGHIPPSPSCDSMGGGSGGGGSGAIGPGWRGWLFKKNWFFGFV